MADFGRGAVLDKQRRVALTYSGTEDKFQLQLENTSLTKEEFLQLRKGLRFKDGLTKVVINLNPDTMGQIVELYMLWQLSKKGYDITKVRVTGYAIEHKVEETDNGISQRE